MKTYLPLVFALCISLSVSDALAQDYRQGRRRQPPPVQQPQPAPSPIDQNPPSETPQLPEQLEEAETQVRQRPNSPKYVTARIFVKPNKSAAPKDLEVRIKGRGITAIPDENGVVEFKVQPNQTLPIEVQSKNYAGKVVDLAVGESSRELEIEIEKLGFFKRLFGGK
ncbi:MAG: hypothetical protein ACOCZ8_05155 [Bacteroidota bacterium]